MSDADFLGVGALADELGLSCSRVRQLEEAGVIPASRRLIPGFRHIWPAGDLDLIRERLDEKRAAGRQRGGPVRAA